MKVVQQGARMADLRALGYSILLKKWFSKRAKLMEDTSKKHKLGCWIVYTKQSVH